MRHVSICGGPSPTFNKLQDFLLTHIWMRTAPRELRHRAGPFHAAKKQTEIETFRANETKYARTRSLTNARIYKRICIKKLLATSNQDLSYNQSSAVFQTSL